MAAAAIAVVIGVVAWVVTGTGSSALPSFTISVSQGSVASPDSLALEHLTGKVKVVPFSDENSAGAAVVSGVATSVITSNPTLVQDYVCAELQGSRDMTGPQAATYLVASSAVPGVPGSEIVAATLDAAQHDTSSREMGRYGCRSVMADGCRGAGPW